MPFCFTSNDERIFEDDSAWVSRVQKVILKPLPEDLQFNKNQNEVSKQIYPLAILDVFNEYGLFNKINK